MNLIPILFLLLTVSLTVFGHAPPSIKQASFHVDTNKIIIEGNHFGSSNPMLFWDQAAEFHSTFPNKNQTQIANRLKYYENLNFFFDHNANHRSGKKSTIYSCKGGKCVFSTPYYLNKRKGSSERIYVSWWYKPSQHPYSDGGANKFIRVWDNSNGVGFRLSWTQMVMGCSAFTYWGDWIGKVGEWNHQELYLDLTQNRTIAKINGKVNYNVTCLPDLKTDLYVQVLGFDNGIGGYGNMTNQLDGVFIGNSTRRLILSHYSNYSQIVLSEVMPIDQWSDERIVANWTEGVLDVNKPIYAHVVGDYENVETIGIPLRICTQFDSSCGSNSPPTPTPGISVLIPLASSSKNTTHRVNSAESQKFSMIFLEVIAMIAICILL